MRGMPILSNYFEHMFARGLIPAATPSATSQCAAFCACVDPSGLHSTGLGSRHAESLIPLFAVFWDHITFIFHFGS